jgi:hypothetical protein
MSLRVKYPFLQIGSKGGWGADAADGLRRGVPFLAHPRVVEVKEANMLSSNCRSWREFCLSRLMLWAFIVTASVPAIAQDNTGMISGSVVDDQGQALPGATVGLIDASTGYARTMVSDARGEFRFLGIKPGAFGLKVDLQGFRSLEKKNITLPTGGTLSLGPLKLSLGAVTETIEVVADGATIQAQNSDHSGGLLTSTQLEQISTIGRDVTSLLRLVPGVSYQTDAESLGGDGFASELPNIGGARKDFNAVTVDGMFGNEIGGANRMSALVNLDAIAEVKVMTSTYKAELGRGSKQVQITRKQGGKEFHGSAGYQKRHESLNANEFFRNKQGLERPVNDYNIYTFSLGGPLGVPGLIDTKKQNKLFFFFSTQRDSVTNPQGVQFWRVPTLLERQGDYSQSFTAPTRRNNPDGTSTCVPSTTLIRVVDPLTGQPFPGNKIPENRIHPSGRALINMYPEPNYQSAFTQDDCRADNFFLDKQRDVPKWNHSLRLDYNISPRDNLFLIVGSHWGVQSGVQVSAGSSEQGRWGLFEQNYEATDRSLTLGHSHTFSGGALNEMLVSYRRQTEVTYATNDSDLERLRRSSVGFGVPNLNPDINPLDLIPNATTNSGSVPGNRAEINISNRFPLDGANFAVNFRDNFTLVKGLHIFKVGGYFEFLEDNEGKGANVGTFNFQHQDANPFSTRYAYANMLVGAFHSYTEDQFRRRNDGRGSLLEWYGQDTFRASRQLTLDYGVRFHWNVQEWKKTDPRYSMFVPSRFDPAKAPLLYLPSGTGAAQRARNPRTGELLPQRFVGGYVPDTGDPINGIVLPGDPTYPDGFRNRPAPTIEPRVGLVYDVSGKGTTVVRGGFGLFHQGQLGVGTVTDNGGNPPFGRSLTTDFGTFDSLASTPRGLIFPGDARHLDPDLKIASMYDFSLGVEQEVLRATILGVSYVGSLGRHLNQTTNINLVPDGARIDPKNINPFTGTVLPDNFLRPYSGYANINARSNFGTSSYHGLQTSLVRRYTKGLQFSVAYTWSRALGLADEDGGGTNLFAGRPVREWHYAPTERSQTHNLQVSYTLDLPKTGSQSPLVRAVLHGWQLSGENSVVSGNWSEVELDRNNYDYTGGTGDSIEYMRPIMTGNPNRRPKDWDPSKPWFDTSVFTRPEPAQPGAPVGPQNYGTTPRRVVRMPGVNNWNLSLFKNFGLGGHRRLQVRWEVYNLLNHTQFDDIDIVAEFDCNQATGTTTRTCSNPAEQLNPNFGLVTSDRAPRRMQAVARFFF